MLSGQERQAIRLCVSFSLTDLISAPMFSPLTTEQSMATKLLRSAYQDILNLLNELYKKWNLVLDKTGTGYADAYSRYKENLPFYIPVTSDAPAIIEFVDITALNWIGSGTGKVLPCSSRQGYQQRPSRIWQPHHQPTQS